jgi:hypothetical protein
MCGARIGGREPLVIVDGSDASYAAVEQAGRLARAGAHA